MFKEIGRELFAYRINDDWQLEITKDSEGWNAYIFRNNSTIKMCIYGEPLQQCTLYSDWKPYDVTLEMFLKNVEYTLQEEDFHFEDYDNCIKAIEEM